MSLPGNGIFVVQGEMNLLVTAMRRGTRWSSHSFSNEEFDVLMRAFQDLKSILSNVDDLRLLDPATYLGPFLEVIRSKETTGPVTNSALSAINKFLSYGLIDPTHPSVPAAVEDIADAVTHARFVGTDPSADGIVLTNILQVLRTLMLSPEGALLTDESVCEIMLTCFRIFFETRLIELLRRNAEQCLRDMTQLIFMRLPQFAPEDLTSTNNFTTIGLSLKKRDKNPKKKAITQGSFDGKASNEQQTPNEEPKIIPPKIPQNKHIIDESEIIIEPDTELIKSPTKKHGRHSSMDLAASNTSITQLLEKCVTSENPSAESENEGQEEELVKPDDEGNVVVEHVEEADNKLEEYVNHRGIRFTPHDDVPNLAPYGLSCIRELLKFLISLCNPHDEQNTPSMVHLGLCLLNTAFEVAGDHMATFPSLLYLVKDPLCRNLLSLLTTEEISILTLNLQVSFLMFESLRYHLKYQMEAFFKKLIEIISTDSTKALRVKEIHHIALESLARMFRIPGLCTELYLNFDCDIYCTNIFEELTKLLSKNVISSTASNIHLLSLEALMTVIEAIENASNEKLCPVEDELQIEKTEPKFGRSGHVSLELGGMDDSSIVSDHMTRDISEYVGSARVGRKTVVSNVPSEAEIDKIKNTKKWITTGTELFNQKPERGIEFLQEHGVLSTPLDPHQVAMFLRENPDLDKKMIGEYVCKRSTNEDECSHPVLAAFASSFDFSGVRIDIALRMYLETFRLPGEAPLIFLVMEKFAEQWHVTNGEPFANTDAAFRLAYAIIMLNMDQHNNNAKKLNLPMNAEDFVKNLRGLNGNGDFDPSLLESIYHSIKNEEMVMPAERSGLVREAYLWRVLQRRGTSASAAYLTAPAQCHHRRLFAEAVAPTVTALSAAFERSSPPTQEEIETNNMRDNVALLALNGIERCAALITRQQHTTTEHITIDTLLLTLCKFTGLLLPAYNNYIAIGVTLGQSTKAQLALRRAFAVCARHADNVRDSWKHLMEIIKTLYIGRLLPKPLIETEDYLSPSGTISLIREVSSRDAGLLSSIYSYIALGDSAPRTPSVHEKALISAASNTVQGCNLHALLCTETKFLHLESLQELVRAMVIVGAPPDCEALQMNPQLEDITIFFLELLGQTLIQNRDRLQTVWPEAGNHIKNVVQWSTNNLTNQYLLTRTLTALLRTSARLMRSEHCAPLVLSNLTVLLALPYKLFYMQADIISCGLYELVKTSAQNVHSSSDWDIVFSLLCAAGAGVWPRDITGTASPTASSRSEGSDDDSDRRPTSAASETELSQSPRAQGWIVVTNKESTKNGIDDVYFRPHLPSALSRCTEALALVVRDVAHVTPDNVRAAVRAVRLFAAAASNARKKLKSRENRKSRSHRRKESSDDEDDPNDQYYIVSMQLLDLMHTLHSRTAQIFRWWREEAEQNQNSEEYDLWEVAWMPLLQGIAQFCTDSRKQVASSAIAYLQRALLSPALVGAGSTARGWEASFNTVLFPLLEAVPVRAKARANTILCKVFLHHLSALSSRPTFSALWIRVITAQRSLVENSSADDPLTEAAVESLKNMILVMDSVKIFSNGEGYTDLWYLTWEKIGEFLPHLKEELFPEAKTPSKSPLPPHIQSSHQIPTLVPLPVQNVPSIVPIPQQTIPSLVPVPPQNIPSLVPISPNTPALVPVPPQSAPTLVPVPPQSTPSLVPIPTQSTPSLVPLVQYPASSQSAFVAYSQAKVPGSTPIKTGMVPIRNQLYTQSGLASSVLLQPLNEMVATSLSITLPSQMPILLPSKIDDNTTATQSTTTNTQSTTLNPTHNIKINEKQIDNTNENDIEPYIIDFDRNPEPDEKNENELYSEYIKNPFTETKDYEDVEKSILDKIIKEKSLSVDSSPMHKPLAHFASTDNIKTEAFNFSNYFGSVSNVIPPGSEILFGNMSTQDG